MLDPVDAVNRQSNGEGPAQRGVAVGWSFADPGASERGDRRLGITLERATYASGDVANAARIEASLSF